MPPALPGGPPQAAGSLSLSTRLRQPAPDAFPLLLCSSGQAGLGWLSAGGIGIYTAGEGLAPEPTPSRPPEPPARGQRPRPSPREPVLAPATGLALLRHAGPGHRHLAPRAGLQVVPMVVTDSGGATDSARATTWPPPCAAALGHQHLQSSASPWAVFPAPARLSPASPGSHAGQHGVKKGCRTRDGGRTRGAGGTSVVPRAFIGWDASAWPGDTLLPAPTVSHWDGTCAQEDAQGGQGAVRAGSPVRMLCTPRPSVPGAWHPACPLREGTGAQRALQAALPGSQERFLPLRRKVCAGSGNTEPFPVRGELSWQQREPPVSWGGLEVSPSLQSAFGPSWAPATAGDGHPLLLLTGEVFVVLL